MIHSSYDDRIMRNVTKQCFPPAIVRLDNEQLQFHHICEGDSSIKNKSTDCTWGFSLDENPPPPPTLSSLRRRKRNSVIQVAITRARPNYPSTGLYYRSIGTKYTEQIGAQTLFLSLFFLAIERKRKRDARIPLRNTRDESQCLNGCLKCGDDPLIRRGGRRFHTSDGISSNLGMIFSDRYLHNFLSRCLSLVTAPSHRNTDSDGKKKTTTEPASLAACLPAPWLASVFFGCIVTAGRTRHLMDRHPSVTNECYNRLASYVSYQ